MTTVVRTSVSNIGSNQIEKAMFGANILSHRDRLGDGTFDDAVEQLGVQALRYPGGSITEETFDIYNPDAEDVIHPYSNEVISLLPLSEFLAYCLESDIQPSIVVPTRLALLDGRHGERLVDVEYIDQVNRFVSDILDGVYGNVEISRFEIGNEYWGSGRMTAVEYGRVADKMAIAIQEAISEHAPNSPNSKKEPDIAVQFGNWGAYSKDDPEKQNRDIIDSLSHDAADAVDAVIAHYYHRNEYNRISTDNWIFNRLKDWTDKPGFESVDFTISEWNINSKNGTEFGLKQASGVLAMFKRMVDAGVDSADIWPIQQNNRTELAGREGETEYSPAGQLFQMMSGSLIGMRSLEVEDNLDTLVIDAFANNSSMELFIHSRSETDFSGSIDINSLTSIFSGHVQVAQVTRLGSELIDSPKAVGIVTNHPIEKFNRELEAGKITVELKPFEIVKIKIVNVNESISKFLSEVVPATNSVEEMLSHIEVEKTNVEESESPIFLDFDTELSSFDNSIELDEFIFANSILDGARVGENDAEIDVVSIRSEVKEKDEDEDHLALSDDLTFILDEIDLISLPNGAVDLS